MGRSRDIKGSSSFGHPSSFQSSLPNALEKARSLFIVSVQTAQYKTEAHIFRFSFVLWQGMQNTGNFFFLLIVTAWGIAFVLYFAIY